ncbi:MAG TPA: PVC-type heme-binding CxxCH protein, partial [Pirellulales bacterium]|nr:PVC-type heme-binding CxxCH protein [Pirellulales bacterium]
MSRLTTTGTTPRKPWSLLLAGLLWLAWVAASLAADGNRLAYLDEDNPWYPQRAFARLTTPQWVGEEGVEAVVVLAIDDMRGHEKWEAFLRPILERLKKIDGRAPVSIMTCQIDPDDPHLQTWLQEGLSLEVHTYDHPCPILQKDDFAKAKSTYDRCVDLLSRVPGSHPVAFRTPCCDSLNTVSPRFFTEIFNRSTAELNYLAIDSSVFNFFTPDDAALPRELVLDERGQGRFLKYAPFDRTFVNRIDDYPYPYVISRLCWEFPCVAPSDWSAQHLQKPNNPLTVADLERAIDATVIKQGVFDLVFHPHGWIRPEQVNQLIDYAVEKHGKRVKFLTFREALERLNKNLLAGQPLRDAFQHRRTREPRSGFDNGVRLLDLNGDGFMDVVIGNQQLQQTRVWSPLERRWLDGGFPIRLVAPVPDGAPQDAGAHFGIGPRGQVFLLANKGARQDAETGLWRFVGDQWLKDEHGLSGLELDGQPIASAASYFDRGLRLRDLDGDGVSECLIANPDQQAVFGWDDGGHAWRRLPFNLPVGVTVVDHRGRDAGLRFVDLDEDGFDDLVFSSELGYSIDLFESMDKGWSRHVASGKRPDDQLVPPIVSGGTNAGAWFASRHLWVQNEATDRLKDLIDRRSYADLLKGVDPPAKSPDASLRSIATRPGFEVQLVACEPLTMDPVAFAWGADGKLWVVEMADYPLGCEGGGRVRYLEDRDGDGRYDAATLFLDGLSYPNGVMPWRKGVLVTCAPEIFYAEDSDGDGRADVRRTLYRGFGEGNPQHRVNGLRWGLDNWVYCANGDSGGGIESLVTGEKVAINGRDFRIRPDEGRIEPQTGQSQFQRERDDWGNWFGNNNSNPMYHFVLDDHYLRRNPHLAAGDPRVQVSLAPGAAAVFPASRTIARFNDQNAANRFTSACSALVYRDELFGPQFAGNSFVSEPVHNLVHREVMYAEGATFHSRRADDEQRSEFLASTDNWFRPAMIRVGPDGALWIADMYRQVIEHPEWIPKDWQARLDLRAGHDKGRIYRVFPVGVQPRPLPRLDQLSINELVAALDSPSGWQRDLVQQLLVERGDQSAVAPLKALLRDAQKPPLARLHALCTLDGLKALDAELLRESLGIHPGVDRHVIRLSEPFLDRSPELAEAIAQRIDADDWQVAMQLAYSLGQWHAPDAGRALGRLALSAGHRGGETGHEGRDYLMTAILSSANNDNLAALVETVFAADDSLDSLDDFVPRMAALLAPMKNDEATLKLLQAMGRPREAGIARWQLTALDGFLDGLSRARRKGTAHNDALASLAKDASAPRQAAIADLNALFESARKTVADPGAVEDDRLRAMQLLGRTAKDRDADLRLLAGLLAPQNSSRLQSGAIAALAAVAGDQAPAALLGGWQAYGPELRAQVVDALLAREAWAERLLAEIREERLPAVALDAARRQR